MKRCNITWPVNVWKEGSIFEVVHFDWSDLLLQNLTMPLRQGSLLLLFAFLPPLDYIHVGLITRLLEKVAHTHLLDWT